jgi:hypothetical protein
MEKKICLERLERSRDYERQLKKQELQDKDEKLKYS